LQGASFEAQLKKNSLALVDAMAKDHAIARRNARTAIFATNHQIKPQSTMTADHPKGDGLAQPHASTEE